MWLFTTEGFFSVVTARDFDHELQIRARSEHDLEQLRSAYFPELSDSVRIPGRDYPVRAFATHDTLASCMSRIAKSIDYGNFKSAVGSRQGFRRAHIYSNVWQDCLQIELQEGAG